MKTIITLIFLSMVSISCSTVPVKSEGYLLDLQLILGCSNGKTAVLIGDPETKETTQFNSTMPCTNDEAT